jgi:hypothetical protein
MVAGMDLNHRPWKRVTGVEWESILAFGFTTEGTGVRLSTRQHTD